MGWTVTVPVGLGFRSANLNCCGTGNTTAWQGGEVVAGIEAVRWVSAHFGLDVQGRAGLFVYNSSVANSGAFDGSLTTTYDIGVKGEGRLAVGLVF